MTIKIKTSEILIESNNPNYFVQSSTSEGSRQKYVDHIKDLIQKAAEETIKIKNRN